MPAPRSFVLGLDLVFSELSEFIFHPLRVPGIFIVPTPEILFPWLAGPDFYRSRGCWRGYLWLIFGGMIRKSLCKCKTLVDAVPKSVDY